MSASKNFNDLFSENPDSPLNVSHDEKAVSLDELLPPAKSLWASDDEAKFSNDHFAAPPLALSTSVRAALDALPTQTKIRSWDIVKAIIDLHPEYAANEARNLALQPGPAPAEHASVQSWKQRAAAAVAVVHGNQPPVVDGRRIIIALAAVDAELASYLRQDGFLDSLLREADHSTRLILEGAAGEKPGARDEPGRLSDPAPLHLDHASVEDRLGRRGFARALARRMDRVWADNREAPTTGSFMLHLHGPWGSGKTSLLNFLRSELQAEERGSRSGSASTDGTGPFKWIVVDFNAWQHQRLNQPWWLLMDKIFREGYRQLRNMAQSPLRAAWFWVREMSWRLAAGRASYLLTLAILILLAGVVLMVLDGQLPSMDKDKLELLGKGLTLVGAVLSATVVFSRSLLSGSTKAAQTFVETAGDPMKRIIDHFDVLIRTIKHPVIVLIDDLDRCQSTYVVNLLEGIQTLFSNPRVVYLIAADRRWIYTCFEQTYNQFADAVREPGRSMGSLFLEKAFELSVSVPMMSPELKARYWDYLVAGDERDMPQQLAAAETEMRKEFQDDMSEDAIVSRLAVTESDAIRRQVRRQMAVEHLSQQHVQASTEYFLSPFARLLEPNPRSMKRLINAYAIHRDLAILSGLDVLAHVGRRKQLALWTILCLRWPALEEYLIRYATTGDGKPSDEVKRLMNSSEVREVIEGEGVDATLGLSDIALLTGFRGSSSNAGAVA